MKRFLFIAVALVIPVLAFAQVPQQRETSMLKTRFGLTDAQASQVIDLQKKTMIQVRKDAVHLRVLRAELEEAVLASNVNQNNVNDLIDQATRTRADMEKTFVGAIIQVRQIVGDDTFYSMMAMLRPRFGDRRGAWDMPRDGMLGFPGIMGMPDTMGMPRGPFDFMVPRDGERGGPGPSQGPQMDGNGSR